MKNFKSILLGTGVAIALFSACETKKEAVLTASNLDPAKFDTVINDKPVKLYVLKNENGMEACITNYGGRIVSLVVPNKDGNPTDVVLGYDNIAQYADTPTTARLPLPDKNTNSPRTTLATVPSTVCMVAPTQDGRTRSMMPHSLTRAPFACRSFRPMATMASQAP